MAFRRQHIRNVRTAIEAGTPLDGEYPFDQTLKTIRAGDGTKAGGHLMKKWGSSYTLAPAQITASQNDYNPTDLAIAETLYLDLDADWSLTGLAGGAADREICIINGSASRLTLAHQNAGSSANNRFSLPGAADLVIRPLASVRLLWKGTLSRWIVSGAGAGWLGVTELPENLSLAGGLTPPQIAADTNNYNPAGLATASRLRLSTDASHNLTGIVGGSNGRLLLVINVGTNPLVLKNADTNSTAANRFDIGADVTLGAQQVALLQYDATDSRWKLAASTAGAAVADGAVTAVKLASSAVAQGPLVNGYLDWSVAGSALTVAVKTRAGADPSPSDPVLVVLRSSTAADAKPVILTLTAALSVVASSGSSLGAVSATPFRIWAVLFNDAGTARLGLINCVSGVNIYPLGAWPVAGSTAEGGAGAADSAQTFYTGTAVTAKAYAVLGYASWEAGLTTAGTWDAAPTRAHMHIAGLPLPGQTLQSVLSVTNTMSTGTTVIPNDDTIPQNTEGDQYLSQAITPNSACNVLDVDVVVNAYHNSFSPVVALFQDSVANALVTSLLGARGDIRLGHRKLAAAAAATTFKVRAGGNGSGTLTVNGAVGARLWGGTVVSFLGIKEIMT